MGTIMHQFVSETLSDAVPADGIQVSLAPLFIMAATESDFAVRTLANKTILDVLKSNSAQEYLYYWGPLVVSMICSGGRCTQPEDVISVFLATSKTIQNKVIAQILDVLYHNPFHRFADRVVTCTVPAILIHVALYQKL
jgi:hypothetical protein